jgi:hypothetical protein
MIQSQQLLLQFLGATMRSGSSDLQRLAIGLATLFLPVVRRLHHPDVVSQVLTFIVDCSIDPEGRQPLIESFEQLVGDPDFGPQADATS